LRRTSLQLLLVLGCAAGCDSDAPPLEPRIDINVKRDGCVASCAVDRFELYLIKALAGRRCVFRRSTR
jgi:hypothetical protein